MAFFEKFEKEILKLIDQIYQDNNGQIIKSYA